MIRKRAIDQIEGIQAGITQTQTTVNVRVMAYEGAISPYLAYPAYIAFDKNLRKTATIQIDKLPSSQKFPAVDERHRSDWDSLWRMINAARSDGIDVLILTW